MQSSHTLLQCYVWTFISEEKCYINCNEFVGKSTEMANNLALDKSKPSAE